jgi:lipoyl(octanoyl) transferase
MRTKTQFTNLGTIDYKAAWDIQEQRFQEVVSSKLKRRETLLSEVPVMNHLIFCEHPHVYTLGRSGVSSNLLITDDLLKKIGATFYKINRGGDITYHGPGQIVGYPIFDLEAMGLGIKEYIHNLEEAIILTLAKLNIEASRLEGATGVWLDVGNAVRTRKICAIGVRASRFVSMHGFALNVNTNLEYFRYINPCGFIDKGVTSVSKEIGEELSLAMVEKLLIENLRNIFQLDLIF